jgi:hypothetical protein
MEGVLVASGMWCEIYPLMPIVERKPNGRNVDVGVPGEGTGWVTDRVLLAPWSIQDREPFLDRAISFPHRLIVTSLLGFGNCLARRREPAWSASRAGHEAVGRTELWAAPNCRSALFLLGRRVNQSESSSWGAEPVDPRNHRPSNSGQVIATNTRTDPSAQPPRP